MKKLLCILFGLMIAAPAFSAGGNGAGVIGGGGSVEYEFVYVTANLHDFLDPCRLPESCGLDAEKAAVLERILHEGTAPIAKALKFESSKKKPELFPVDETGRVPLFATSQFQGSTVYVNQDLLYVEVSPGQWEALPPTEVVRAVTEFASFQFGLSKPAARLFAASISRQWSGQTQTLSLSRYNQSSRFMVMAAQGTPELVFSDAGSAQKITSLVLAHLPCPRPEQSPTRLRGLDNLHWESVVAVSEKEAAATIGGEVVYSCSEGADHEGNRVTFAGKIQIRLPLAISNGSAQDFLNGSDRVEIRLIPSEVRAKARDLRPY